MYNWAGLQCTLTIAIILKQYTQFYGKETKQAVNQYQIKYTQIMYNEIISSSCVKKWFDETLYH